MFNRILIQSAFVAICAAFVVGTLTFASEVAKPIRPKVTMIGDSHTALAFGEYFYQELSDEFNIHLLGSSGSRPKHWVREPHLTQSKNGATEYIFGSRERYRCHHSKEHKCDGKKHIYGKDGSCCIPTAPLNKILAQDQPDFLIVALGANLSRAGMRTVEAELSTLATQIKNGTPCFWVAPPFSSQERFKNQKKVNDYLNTNSEIKKRCTVYDSSVITATETAKDGTHYSAEQLITRIWAKDVATHFRKFVKQQREK